MTTVQTTSQRTGLVEATPIPPMSVDSATARKRFGFGFWLAIGWLVVIVLCAIFVDVLPVREKNNPDFLLAANVGEGDWTSSFTSHHLLGVDESGNDLLAYALHGSRISLIVGIGTISLAFLVGGWLGMIAGYFRGRADALCSFLANALLSIPPLLFLLLLVSVLTSASGGVSLWKFILTLGLLSTPVVFRVVRAATMQQSRREYILAASALGASRTRILLREIFPNVVKPALAYALVAVGTIMVVEGTVSFLGAGLSPTTISWGKMLQVSTGIGKLKTGPHATFVPAAFLFLTVLSLNFIGDKVRERLEVKQGAI